MGNGSLPPLTPRKSPRQGRSIATVDAIFEATIQVLLSDGLIRINTTRVARRAGVSVGTLYQYFPNKQALLFAVFEDHMNKVAVAGEVACERACHQPLADMIQQLVEAYVNVKMDRADISVALYKVVPGVGGHAVVERLGRRLRKAIEAMLQTATDVELPPDKFAIDVMMAAMSGAMRSALESGASPATFRKMREHLVLLCQSYMKAVTAPRI